MMRQRLLIGVGVLMVFGIVGCQHAPREDRPAPKKHTVRIEGMVFLPSTLSVSAGDTVVWVNKDLVPHAAATSGAGFESKAIAFNESFSHTFSTPGEFDYVCPFHPTMKATLQVR
jgi:plastocyanin